MKSTEIKIKKMTTEERHHWLLLECQYYSRSILRCILEKDKYGELEWYKKQFELTFKLLVNIKTMQDEHWKDIATNLIFFEVTYPK